jgi:hypothetical protein
LGRASLSTGDDEMRHGVQQRGEGACSVESLAYKPKEPPFLRNRLLGRTEEVNERVYETAHTPRS